MIPLNPLAVSSTSDSVQQLMIIYSLVFSHLFFFSNVEMIKSIQDIHSVLNVRRLRNHHGTVITWISYITVRNIVCV